MFVIPLTFTTLGIKNREKLFIPTEHRPSLQYFETVHEGSVAHKAGLKPGDFLLEVWFSVDS